MKGIAAAVGLGDFGCRIVFLAGNQKGWECSALDCFWMADHRNVVTNSPCKRMVFWEKLSFEQRSKIRHVGCQAHGSCLSLLHLG